MSHNDTPGRSRVPCEIGQDVKSLHRDLRNVSLVCGRDDSLPFHGSYRSKAGEGSLTWSSDWPRTEGEEDRVKSMDVSAVDAFREVDDVRILKHIHK